MQMTSLKRIYYKETPAQIFSCEICEIFKYTLNTPVVASDSLINAFAQQMFTLQQNNMVPKTILKIFSQRKDALEWRLATKIMCSFYFHFYSFVTGMANTSSNNFISNVLLKNPTERNA